MRNAADYPLLEGFLESAQAGIELISHSEVLGAVPVVGIAFKVFKGLHDLRTQAFMAKLAKFVTDPSLQSADAKSALAQMAVNPNEDSRKIGEALFLVLERLTDMEKAALLARAFAGYLGGKITGDELRRLAPAIDAGYIDDLNMLIDAQEPIEPESAVWMRPLVVAGLTEQGVPGPIGGKLVWRLTPLGLSLRKAIEV